MRSKETAMNSSIIDKTRLIVSFKNHPSLPNTIAYLKRKVNQPHSEWDNSTTHYKSIVGECFRDVRFIPFVPFVTFERFHRLVFESSSPTKRTEYSGKKIKHLC